MKSLCVITIKINTLTDVPYQMTVGGAFVYIFKKPVKDNGRVHITRSVIMLFFPVDPDGRIIMESQCIGKIVMQTCFFMSLYLHQRLDYVW